MILINFVGWLYITCGFSFNFTESRYLSRPVDLNFGPKNGQNQDIWSKSTAQGLKIWQPISPVPGLKSRLHSYVPEFWRLISFLCISRLKKKIVFQAWMWSGHLDLHFGPEMAKISKLGQHRRLKIHNSYFKLSLNHFKYRMYITCCFSIYLSVSGYLARPVDPNFGSKKC